MTDQVWRGCVVPDDRLYDLALHVWVVPDGEEVVLGMTDVAQTMGGRMVQVSFKRVGRTVTRGQSCAVVESAKWVGPFPSPLSGVLVATNEEAFAADVAAERHHLTEGSEAFAAYRRYIEEQDMHCMRCVD